MAWVSLSLVVVGCGMDESQPFDAMNFQKPYRDQATPGPVETLGPLPNSSEPAYPTTAEAATRPAAVPATGPTLSDEPTVVMSLQEIIHRAVLNNHDVRAAGYGPAIEATRVVEADAHFDPDLFFNVDFEHKNELTAGQLISDPITQALTLANFNQSDIYTGQAGIKQNTWTGGQIQLQYQVQYQFLNPRVFTLNPFYDNNLTLQVTQPLLRDFGYDVNRARIVIARDNQKIGLLDFRKAMEQNLSDIEQAYWQLVQANGNVKVQEHLLDMTQTTYDVLYKRFQLKVDVSQLELAQAETSLETRRTGLIQAKAQVRETSAKIKQLMADPDYPVTSATLIQPADPPVLEPIEFNLQDQVDTALENRYELSEQMSKIDIAEQTAAVGKNNLLPQLNLVGSVGPEGTAGDEGKAFDREMQWDHLDYGVGFQFEYPLGNRAARAIWKRTLLQRMQAIEQYRALIDQVTLDVQQALYEVSSAWHQIDTTRRARFRAEQAVQSIEDKQASGEALTPTFVELKLDRQDILASAQQEENRATAAYNIALSNLEKAKGTLLKYDNVIMEENPALFTNKALLK
jgi:outer membrane protein TolC